MCGGTRAATAAWSPPGSCAPEGGGRAQQRERMAWSEGFGREYAERRKRSGSWIDSVGATAARVLPLQSTVQRRRGWDVPAQAGSKGDGTTEGAQSGGGGGERVVEFYYAWARFLVG
jgi:hypothetical protein